MSSRESDELRAQVREKHMAGDTPGASLEFIPGVKLFIPVREYFS